MEVRIFVGYGEGRVIKTDKDVNVVIVNVQEGCPKGSVTFHGKDGVFGEDGKPVVLIGSVE